MGIEYESLLSSILIMVVPIYFQALLMHPYYASSSSCRLVRISLIPVVFTGVILYWKYSLLEPKINWAWVNFTFSVVGTTLIMQSIEYGFIKGPYRFVGIDDKPAKKLNGTQNGNQKERSIDFSDESSTLVERLLWAFSLSTSLRGIGWNWGIPLQKLPPPFAKRGQTKQFIKAILLDVVSAHIICTFSITYAINAAQRDLDYLPLLPDLSEHFTWDNPPLSSIIATYCLGVGIWTGLVLMFDLSMLILFCLNLLIRSLPIAPSCIRPDQLDYELWRPIFGPRPYLTTSLTEFWGRKWHGIFFQSFLVCGVWPTRKILSPILGKKVAGAVGVFSAFLISGLFHEFGIWRAAPEEYQARPFLTTLFFSLQGIAIFLEYIFAETTGVRVRGFFGWLWTTTILICTGHILLEAWLQQGMTSGVTPMSEWSWHHFVFPLACIL